MQEYVQVPVPAPLVPAVMRFLADHLGDDLVNNDQDRKSAQEGGQGRVETVGDTEWTKDQLCRMYTESSQNLKTVLGVLISSAEEWVPSVDLYRPLGADANSSTLSGTLSGLTRRHGRYGGHVHWPFSWQWNAAKNCVEYRMRQAVADVLSEVV